MGSLHVIADLHLDPGGDPRIPEFQAFCRSPGLQHLVILGDLFEAWFGPKTARLEGAEIIMRGLEELVRRGVAVDLVPGNRDFLLDQSFALATGVRLHPRGLCLAERGILMLHGDELCTKDHGYLALRAVLRSWPLRLLVRVLPEAWAASLARRLRSASTRAVARKENEHKAMQPAEAERRVRREGAQTLVVGHVHERSTRELAGGRRWYCLDGWGGAGDTLVFDGAAEPHFIAHQTMLSEGP